MNKGHGNIKLDNDKGILIKVVFQCPSYIGYPRRRNTITYINDAKNAFK
ncbi:MAG: hypothetical protein ACLRWH_05940 [Emergencia sp.]|nr:hypothetical protein [Emergencia sp.]